MIAVGRGPHPMRGVLLGDLKISRRTGDVAAQPAQIPVARQAENGFDGKIGVVGQVAHEIIGAKLVLRVESVFLQIHGPLCQLGPPWIDKMSVSVKL